MRDLGRILSRLGSWFLWLALLWLAITFILLVVTVFTHHH